MKAKTLLSGESPDSSMLLNKIAQGDEAAFQQLFDDYYQKLLRLAVYFLKSKELAEEAVSDIFIIIWEKRKTLEHILNIEKYLCISVKNQALQYIRRSPSLVYEPLYLFNTDLIPDTDNPELSLLDEECNRLIQSAINTLPEKCREVFCLSFDDKLKHKEIAQHLNISIKTVEAHIATANKRIAQYVNKEYATQLPT